MLYMPSLVLWSFVMWNLHGYGLGRGNHLDDTISRDTVTSKGQFGVREERLLALELVLVLRVVSVGTVRGSMPCQASSRARYQFGRLYS